MKMWQWPRNQPILSGHCELRDGTFAEFLPLGDSHSRRERPDQDRLFQKTGKYVDFFKYWVLKSEELNLHGKE